MGEPETVLADDKNINIAMGVDEHRHLLMLKVEMGVPHWRDFIIAGGEALRREHLKGNLREVARTAYERMGRPDDADRISQGIRTSSYPPKSAKKA